VSDTTEGIISVGMDENGDELVRSASVQVAIQGVSLSYRIEGSGNDRLLVLSWDDIAPESRFVYGFNICHPRDELVVGDTAHPRDCRDGEGFLVDPTLDDGYVSNWIRSSTEVAFRLSDSPWYGGDNWLWIAFSVSIYNEESALISAVRTETNWVSFSRSQLDGLSSSD